MKTRTPVVGRRARPGVLLCGVLLVVAQRCSNPGAAREGAPPVDSRGVGVYASVGPALVRYELDVTRVTLARRETVTLPENVQYVWPHPSGRWLYVAWSDGVAGAHHGAAAFVVDPSSGVLRPAGVPVDLPARPIHVSVDPSGRYALFAHNAPSGVTVHGLNIDGTIGARVGQPASIDAGAFAHQCLVDPSGALAVLVARGNGPATGKAEDPGALKILKFDNGVLTNLASVAPGGGYGFQPRHADFDPRRPWLFVSVERQNRLHVYRRRADGVPEPLPAHSASTLADPEPGNTAQVAGAVHLHPNGRTVYVANRANGTILADGTAVFGGGENSIAVFSIDQETGEPKAVQHADTRGFVPRTFALDPDGRVLVAANQVPMAIRADGRVTITPASLALFRVAADGRLDFVRRYGVDTPGTRSLFWVGVVSWSR